MHPNCESLVGIRLAYLPQTLRLKVFRSPEMLKKFREIKLFEITNLAQFADSLNKSFVRPGHSLTQFSVFIENFAMKRFSALFIDQN